MELAGKMQRMASESQVRNGQEISHLLTLNPGFNGTTINTPWRGSWEVNKQLARLHLVFNLSRLHQMKELIHPSDINAQREKRKDIDPNQYS